MEEINSYSLDKINTLKLNHDRTLMFPRATSLTNMSLVPLLAASEYLALVLQNKRYGETSDYDKLYAKFQLFTQSYGDSKRGRLSGALLNSRSRCENFTKHGRQLRIEVGIGDK